MRYTRPAKPTPTLADVPLEKGDTGGLSNNQPIQTWRYGWHIRPGSLWIGAHWSTHNKRLCINLLPCVTVWVVMPGGFAP